MSPRAESRLGARIRAVEAIPLRIPFRRAFTMATVHQPTREHIDVLLVRIRSEAATPAWARPRRGAGRAAAKRCRPVRQVPRHRGAAADRSLGDFDIGPLMRESETGWPAASTFRLRSATRFTTPMARCLGPCLVLRSARRFMPRANPGRDRASASPATPPAMIDAAERSGREGYRHIRIKIGIDPRATSHCSARCASTSMTRIVLRADANGGMKYGDALRLLGSSRRSISTSSSSRCRAGISMAWRRWRALFAFRCPPTNPSPTRIRCWRSRKRGAARVFQTKSAKTAACITIRRLWALARRSASASSRATTRPPASTSPRSRISPRPGRAAAGRRFPDRAATT